jgi:glyoxylase-like metal-dependent hydrolase (beta-lactamase superfamily II)
VTIELVKTSGIFSLDGDDFEVENNVWIVGDEREVMIIDAAHDHRPIAEAVGGRATVAIVATHGHNDHINAARALAEVLGAPILLHPDDLMLWQEVYPDRNPDGYLANGMELSVGDASIEVLHTPGHTPGGCCLYLESEAVLFTGDTLFRGGPGATGRRYSDFPTIIASIREQLLVLPAVTRALPGHGEETTIGTESPHLGDWLVRGS